MPDITMKRERTDRWTKVRPSRARSSGPVASCHMLSSADCITTTSESEFSVHTSLLPATHARRMRNSAKKYSRFGKTRRGKRKPRACAGASRSGGKHLERDFSRQPDNIAQREMRNKKGD